MAAMGDNNPKSPKKAKTDPAPKIKAKAQVAAPGAKATAKPTPAASAAAPGAEATEQPTPAASAAVSGAPSESSSASFLASPWSLSALMEMETIESQSHFIRGWSRAVKKVVDAAVLTYMKEHRDSFTFPAPADVMSIPPLAISDAASGAANLTSFREVMNYDNLISSFQRTGQYEAAGTLWMLDPSSPDDSVSDESVTIAMIEAARWQWSEEVFIQSSPNPELRRFSFDVPLPARMDKAEMARRAAPGASGVSMTAPLPMIAGKAHVLAWYSAVSDALHAKNEQRMTRLMEAALSVPIRVRLCPDTDACALASLQYAEAATMYAAASGADSFWVFAERVGRIHDIQDSIKANISAPKLHQKVKNTGHHLQRQAYARTPCEGDEELDPLHF